MAWNALLATRNSDLFNSFNCFSQQMEFIVLLCLKWCWLKAVNSSDACIEHYCYDNKKIIYEFFLWFFFFFFPLFLTSSGRKKHSFCLSSDWLCSMRHFTACHMVFFLKNSSGFCVACLFHVFVGFPVIILLKACSHQLTFYNWFLWLLFGQFLALLAMQQLIANIWDIFSLPCNHG